MINGFEKETQPLTTYEMEVLLPVIVRGLLKKIGRDRAVTNKHIVTSLKDRYKISEPRVRKIINHIRINDFVPGLVATSDGYFVAENERELMDYEESLRGREEAIRAVRSSITRQRIHLFGQNVGVQGKLL